MKPRLEIGDLVRVRRGMTIKGLKIKTKDNGILLNQKFVNGLSVGQVYWQQLGKYSEDIPTEHLIRVEEEVKKEETK